ncbi:cell wall anchor protein [Flavisolibacter tropicus]|uniref:Cell wall anchor protein n=1 Tax=Flavisolibacter tropicus TaxID=1492898 RepID=A0A172U314_9BACT|nr:cell wall anchor protein [Flavisolibacter tropicus]
MFITSCEDDNGDIEQQKAQVMVVHASPNAPNVDVRINNAVALSNVSYPNNSPYTPVDAGTANFKLSPAGTTTYVIDANVPLTANNYYSVFAIDSVNKIKPAVVGDNLTAPASGKAHVRFFHFSPNAPAVDIAVTDGPVLFNNRTFNDQSTTATLANFTPVDAGTYNLEVRIAGTKTVALPLPNITLTAGKIYTVFAKGFVGGTGAQALGAQIILNK